MMGGSNKRAMLFSFSVVVICLLTVIGGGSFSLLWIQHQVSKEAKYTVLLEKRYQEILRKLDHLDERIAKVHQPIFLQSKVSNRLVPIMDKQIVWVESTGLGAGIVYVNSQKQPERSLRN